MGVATRLLKGVMVMRKYAISFWDAKDSCPGVNYVRGNSEDHAIERWAKELDRLNIEGRLFRSIVDVSALARNRMGKEFYFVY